MSEHKNALIEEVVGAWRPVDPFTGAVRGHPAWHDLDPADRQTAFEETLLARALESALDPEGLSATARAVLKRIRR